MIDSSASICCSRLLLDAIQFGNAVFQRIGRLVDALDALQPALQLDLVLADLGFHRRHDRPQPDFGILVGMLEGTAHLDRHFLEELSG
jgi:hypothetical protein